MSALLPTVVMPGLRPAIVMRLMLALEVEEVLPPVSAPVASLTAVLLVLWLVPAMEVALLPRSAPAVLLVACPFLVWSPPVCHLPLLPAGSSPNGAFR